MRNRLPTSALATVAALGLISFSATPADAGKKDSIADLVGEDDRFETLRAAVEVAGLAETLDGGSFTVFAPTDEAFAKLPAGTVETLLENPDDLREILLYHVTEKRQRAKRLLRRNLPVTVQGEPLVVSRDGDDVFVNGARVELANVKASNGIVHVIDTVLLPPAAENLAADDLVDVLTLDGRFTTLLAAVEVAELTETLRSAGPFTLAAPTDEAFAMLPPGTVEGLLADKEALTRILLYHVFDVRNGKLSKLVGRSIPTLAEVNVGSTVREDGVYFNDSRVLSLDIKVPNGRYLPIDAVLLPPAADATLIDVLEARGDYTTLLTAIDAAGLTETLRGEGPFTIKAPNDDAFAALPDGTVEALLNDIPALTDILLFHVSAGESDAFELAKRRSVRTLQGAKLRRKGKAAVLTLNGVAVIEPNLVAPNGIAHGIESVLLPPAPKGGRTNR